MSECDLVVVWHGGTHREIPPPPQPEPDQFGTSKRANGARMAEIIAAMTRPGRGWESVGEIRARLAEPPHRDTVRVCLSVLVERGLVEKQEPTTRTDPALYRVTR